MHIGSTRTAIITKHYVIKIPKLTRGFDRFLEGWYKNRLEYKKCHYYGYPELMKSLCPVVESFLGSIIIVMPKCEVLTKREFESLKAEGYIDSVIKQLHGFQCYDVKYGDFRYYNWGKLNGKIVLFDYGLPNRNLY